MHWSHSVSPSIINILWFLSQYIKFVILCVELISNHNEALNYFLTTGTCEDTPYTKMFLFYLFFCVKLYYRIK